MTKPLLVTMGEPAGISPEITALAWSHLRDSGPAFALIGDPSWFNERCPTTPVTEISDLRAVSAAFREKLPVLPHHLATPSIPGKPDSANASAVTGAIERAVKLSVAEKIAGIITNPIQKETLYAAGFQHQGHTDFLAALAAESGIDCTPVMMLAAPGLRTVPVTVHVALRQIWRDLSPELIFSTASITARDLTQRFGIKRPRIAIAGLNPHAGENGTMGSEEQTIIMPAISKLRAEGLNVIGPLPADTMFHEQARAAYDVALCMYHDQALIPVKTLDFHGGVNITLGLPFIRTSPDHGTALALAGTGKANPASLIAAIKTAAEMAKTNA